MKISKRRYGLLITVVEQFSLPIKRPLVLLLYLLFRLRLLQCPAFGSKFSIYSFLSGFHFTSNPSIASALYSFLDARIVGDI